MAAIYEEDLIGCSNFLLWRQVDGCSVTDPFSLCKGQMLQHGMCNYPLILASFPGSRAEEEEREPGTHCLHMCQVPYSATLEISVYLLKGHTAEVYCL